ncbi:hypothetical protein [Geopseudomonas aromaticivorans]
MTGGNLHLIHFGAPGRPGASYAKLAEGDFCFLGLYDAKAFCMCRPRKRVVLGYVIRRSPGLTRVTMPGGWVNLGSNGLPAGDQPFIPLSPTELPFYLCVARKGATRELAIAQLREIELAIATYEPTIDRQAVLIALTDMVKL